MEVLPPADVWDNIPPMPVRRIPVEDHYRVSLRVSLPLSPLHFWPTWYLRSNNTGDTAE
ncbi:MAG: hypothetical protein MZV63_69285 [Marinilabiliales bacterium]|nr:hypothetical protein [Marinilabiliales bacterium]